MPVKKLLTDLRDTAGTGVDMTDKQISIISAAVDIFAEKGYAATRTSEIARKAGVAEGTIFHHYKTKKDLLLAIPDYLSKSPVAQIFLHDLGKIFDHPHEDFEDFLRAIIRNRINFASENMTLVKVLFQEVPFQPELRSKISKIIMFPLKGKFVAAIEKFKALGQLTDIPAEAVFNLLITTILGYVFAHHIAMFELNWDSEKDPDYLIRYIMNGLCGCKD